MADEQDGARKRTLWVLPVVLGCAVLAVLAIALMGRNKAGQNGRAEMRQVQVPAGTASETGRKVVLKVGDDAPLFSLVDQDGKMVSLSDFTGKRVLVYFYPKADSPGCTRQACSVRDSAEPLKRDGVVPLGISPDEPNEQLKFSEKYSLGFRLLSDTDHKVAKEYGVWGEREIAGKKIMGIIRSSFLVDENGKLLGVWYDVKPEDTVPNALTVLQWLISDVTSTTGSPSHYEKL
jgi:peroxiredoxin Q/BCP